LTKRLLTCAVAAGPLFVLVSLVQSLTRPGFNLLHQPVSMLTLGDLGWIQRTNFLLTGALYVIGAFGLRRALRGQPGGRCGPILMGLVAGLAGGGVFLPDAGNGFPVGARAGIPSSMSLHGVVHMVCGSVAFLSLIALCFVLGHHFARVRQGGWAVGGRISGTLFALCLLSAGAPGGTLALFVGGSIAFIFVSAASGKVMIREYDVVSSVFG